MERFTYRAYLKENHKLASIDSIRMEIEKMVNSGILLTASMFSYDRNLFVYWETIDKNPNIEIIFAEISDSLMDWPGEFELRKWIRMMDIYHCAEPQSVDHWRRKQPIKSIRARVMRLKPDMLSSYIYYHWALQEGSPGSWCKYCSIYLHEDLTIMFNEDPDPAEKQPYKGKLDNYVKPENWGELMYGHCVPWENAPADESMWKETELLWMYY